MNTLLFIIALWIPFSEQALPAGDFVAAQDEDAREVLIEMAEEAIYARYSGEEYRFELKVRWLPGSLQKANPEAIQSVRLNGELQRYSSFNVNYILNNGQSNSIDIQLKVEAEQMLPVAINRLMPGHTLSAADFTRRWVPIRIDRDKPVSDIRELEGKTLRRMVNAGNPVIASEISAPYMVNAGDEIELNYDEHGIQIILTCEARQNGTRGEEITIYCKETRRKYTGLVTGPGVVQWQKTK